MYVSCLMVIAMLAQDPMAPVAKGSAKDPMQLVYRLVGQWRTNTGQGPICETWTRQSANSLVGNSRRMTRGADGPLLETLEIVRRDAASAIVYRATVVGQNGGKTIDFVMTAYTDTTITFENPAHDFPQKIEYTFVDAENIKAEVSAIKDGRKRAFTLEYVPVAK